MNTLSCRESAASPEARRIVFDLLTSPAARRLDGIDERRIRGALMRSGYHPGAAQQILAEWTATGDVVEQRREVTMVLRAYRLATT